MSSVKAGRQPVLPSPGWGRWPRSGRMRSSPRPAFAACPPASIPRAPGPETPGKSAMHYFQRRAGGSPYCLPPVGGPERPEKSPVDCFQRKAGGSPGRWPRSGRMRSSPPGIPPLAAEDTPSSLPNLPADACQADDLIRLLASARIHLPQPGEGLRSLPCCTHDNAAVSKTSPVDCFQRKAGGSPGRLRQSLRMILPLQTQQIARIICSVCSHTPSIPKDMRRLR